MLGRAATLRNEETMASLEQRVGAWKGERGWRVCFGPPGAEARVSMKEDYVHSQFDLDV